MLNDINLRFTSLPATLRTKQGFPLTPPTCKIRRLEHLGEQFLGEQGY